MVMFRDRDGIIDHFPWTGQLFNLPSTHLSTTRQILPSWLEIRSPGTIPPKPRAHD
jgi:hypothetical protein